MTQQAATCRADSLVLRLQDYLKNLILQSKTGPLDRISVDMPETMPRRPATQRGISKRGKALRNKPLTLAGVVSHYGMAAKAKLANPSVKGQPEDQLKAPVESLLSEIALLAGHTGKFVAVGETPIPEIHTRPDFSITLDGLLVGHVELKSPGKGADPRRFRDKHDKKQWANFQSLPNVIYTDGNSFSLWRNGALIGDIVTLYGDIESSGAELATPDGLLTLVTDFFRWQPHSPKNARELAETSARLCRLLRDQVVEQLVQGAPALTKLREDWCHLLFPDADNLEFADGYAQTVTFGMLVARAQNISLSADLDRAAQQLGQTLIGTALRVLTFGGRSELTTIRILQRTLDVVDWSRVSQGDPEAWLYFYEDFLAVYDNRLRKQTGSYYTPAPLVTEMVRLVDEVLASRFGLTEGLASHAVTIADPAVGTGTFLLGILRRIAATVETDQGAGAVAAVIDDAVRRLIAFECQLGPFAVAQLRVLGELRTLIGRDPSSPPRMFVTDTLANPYIEEEWLPEMLAPIAESRRQANKIKTQERIRVVIGNPPYKEKARGKGGWIEDGGGDKDGARPSIPPLDAWIPPASWGLGGHTKHLRNKYIYFWRWATWKVFDQDPTENSGIICFISVSGFLNGPGFERMRDYLRRKTDDIWVIDCSPEGHQPDVPTRIFEDVQQPICIVLAQRSPDPNETTPAKVWYRCLPSGTRGEKIETLKQIRLDGPGWRACPDEWRSPFLAKGSNEWESYPSLNLLFSYNGAGSMAGRTWVIAPDQESLEQRWKALINAEGDTQERLFHPHLRKGKPGDRHTRKSAKRQIAGCDRTMPVADDNGACVPPVRYGFRSFDRQWILPDARLINRPNPELWAAQSRHQVYLTCLMRHSPTAGPAVTATAFVPDHDHYKGSFSGRVFPLWLDAAGRMTNVRPRLLQHLSERLGREVSGEDLVAYVMAIAACPAYTERFRGELKQPGLRLPITTDADLFFEAAAHGKHVLWLHTFGDRFADPGAGRPKRRPRLPESKRPRIPKNGAISTSAGDMPDGYRFVPAENRLYIGTGFIDNVTDAMMSYEVSGKEVVHHWFSYRKADRCRPVMGDRRPPSPLSSIQPDGWKADYTTELLELLNVLGLLRELEPNQADLLDRVCAGDTFAVDELEAAGAFKLGKGARKPTAISTAQESLPF